MTGGVRALARCVSCRSTDGFDSSRIARSVADTRGDDPMHRRGLGWLRFLVTIVAAILLTIQPSILQSQLLPVAKAGDVAQAPRSLRIALFAQSVTLFLPHMVAERLGYFRAEGLEVSLIQLGSSAEGNAAVISGSADLAYSTPEQVLKVRRAGINA